MESQLVGFIGIGRMGGPMSSRLLDAGYSLCVFDTNPDVVKPLAARGVEVVGSPAEVASIAQIVLMSLPTTTIGHQRAPAADVSGSPAEVASIAQIVLMSLPTPTIVQKVALGDQGVVHGSKVKTLVDLSTTGPGVAGTVGQGVAEHGITLVDSPVSGGVAGAKAGTLAVVVAWPGATLA